MSWKDLFGKKETPGPDPIHDLTLEKLKVGYLVDYDLRTWEVTAYNSYDWGEGYTSHEWQLVCGDETIYLEREEDDKVFWSMNREIPFSRLDPGIRNYIKTNEDPPKEITLDGMTYYQEEMAGGHFYKDGTGPGQELLEWCFEDESGKKLLTIEQWGEDEFEAFIGEQVEEYQFTNILPRERKGN